jgi:glycosyltransferase involved in cell wall biosynthesis
VSSGAPVLVSVILPTYNRERLVLEAVASVLEQTLADFELLVVDDGSTDGTEKAIRDRFGADPRMVYLRKRNGGTATARNHGLERARGDFVAFLDSDDRFLPEYLAEQVRCLRAHPEATLSVCDARYEGAWGRDAPTMFQDRQFKPPRSMQAMLEGAWAIPSCMTFRGEAIRPLRFQPSYRYSEDTEFLFRFFAAGNASVLNAAVLTVYRKHDGSNGQAQKIDQADRMQEDMLRMMEAYASYAADPRLHRERIFAKRRNLAKRLVERGRWRDARPHLWGWVKARPSSTRALRWWVRSLFSR